MHHLIVGAGVQVQVAWLGDGLDSLCSKLSTVSNVMFKAARGRGRTSYSHLPALKEMCGEMDIVADVEASPQEWWKTVLRPKKTHSRWQSVRALWSEGAASIEFRGTNR